MSDLMKSLLFDLGDAEPHLLTAATDGVVKRLSQIGRDEQRSLLGELMELRASTQNEGILRTKLLILLQLLLKVSGVRTIETSEDNRIRAEISQTWSQLNGEADSYRDLGWRPAHTS